MRELRVVIPKGSDPVNIATKTNSVSRKNSAPVNSTSRKDSANSIHLSGTVSRKTSGNSTCSSRISSWLSVPSR